MEGADLFGQTQRQQAIDQLHAATAIYTTEPVVTELLEAVHWPGEGRLLVDTSCGDGAFVGKALERLLDECAGASEASICAQLEGWEIHPHAAGEARARLRHTMVQRGFGADVASRVARGIVRTGDFITEGPQCKAYDIVIGNPPYLRKANVPALLQAEYENVVPLYAQADLLYSFLDRSVRTLKSGGVIAMVTSDRWLSNLGSAELRERLGEHVGIAEVRRLDPASTFYRPKLRRAGTPPRVHPVAVVLRPREDAAISLSRAPVYPGANDRKWETGLTLDDVAKVRLSPWLGTPGCFVVDAQTARKLPAECLVPAVDTDDIRDGAVGTAKRFAILTFPDRVPPEVVMEHLDAVLERMCARGRRAKRWLPPESFHEMDLTRPSLLVPRIAKTLRPVRIPAGTLPINHNLSIVGAGQWTLEEIEESLMSREANEWMTAHAARLENGYFSLTTRLLRTLPVRRVAAEMAACTSRRAAPSGVDWTRDRCEMPCR